MMTENNTNQILLNKLFTGMLTMMAAFQTFTKYIFVFVIRLTVIVALIIAFEKTQPPGYMNILKLLMWLCVLSFYFQSGIWILKKIDLTIDKCLKQFKNHSKQIKRIGAILIAIIIIIPIIVIPKFITGFVNTIIFAISENGCCL